MCHDFKRITAYNSIVCHFLILNFYFIRIDGFSCLIKRITVYTAVIIGINGYTYEKIEIGDKVPDAKIISKLCNFYNVSLSFFDECSKKETTQNEQNMKKTLEYMEFLKDKEL